MKLKIFKTLYTLRVLVFSGILVLPTLGWILMLIFYPDTVDAMDTKLNENRNKAAFPSTFNASTITKELEEYYNDHAPFRSILILSYQKGESKLENIYLTSIKPKLSNILYGSGGTEEEKLVDYEIGSLFEPPSTSDEDKEPLSDNISQPDTEEHQYKEISRTEPTCTNPGSILYECSDCGNQYTEELPAKGHQNIYAATIEASYTEYGCDLYLCTECMYLSKENITGKLIDTSYFAPSTIGEEVLLGRFGWLFFTGDDCISYYKGTNILKEETMKEFLDAAAELDELCQSKNIQMQLLIAPNKSQIYPEFMPSYTIEDGKKREEVLVDYFKEHSGPALLYPLEELQAAKPYWPVYYNLDTHWNEIGAFIALQTIYRELGLPTTNIFDLKYSEEERIGGDLVLLARNEAVNNILDTEYHLEYKPEISITESSGNYITDPIFRSHSTSPNECNMVMIADSYRINMTPYIIKDFSDCTIIHRDSLNEVKDTVKNADILIITCVERYDMDMLKSIKETINILKENE